jgi:hypothetical protein
MRLFQRGNRLHPANAIIRYPFSAVREAFASGRMGAADPLGIHRVDLGDVDGIPYSFTDAAALPDGRTLFTAVAEDTNDSYNDGPCVGAGIGLLDKDGTLRWLRPLDRPHKVEGIDARIDGGVIRLLLVTDADDPDRAASLFSATLET